MNCFHASSRGFGCIVPVLCVLFFSGFTFPSTHELRREFQAELEKIRERTPGARALANWNSCRDMARTALRDAEINSAPEYAPEEYTEAADLFERASRYAVKRSYRKASYLAKKSAEVAESASEHAKSHIEDIEKSLLKKLDILQKKLDRIRSMLSLNSSQVPQLAGLFLQWSDIRHCISIGLYKEAGAAIPSLKRNISIFMVENGIPPDEETEKWEETI